MRRFLSPAMFAVVVACFLLPFVSVSCSTAAAGPFLEGFQEGLEGAGGEGQGGQGGQGGLGDLPLGQDGELQIVRATGFEVAMGSAQPGPEFEELAELGGQQATETDEAPMPGRIWVIVVLAAAVLGVALTLLAGSPGAWAGIALGLIGAATLGVFALTFGGGISDQLNEGGGQGGAPFDVSSFFNINFEYGYWLALLFFLAAAGAAIWRLLSYRPAVAGVGYDPAVGGPTTPMPPPVGAPGTPSATGGPASAPGTMPPTAPPPPAPGTLPPRDEPPSGTPPA
jgi:hypothetical protein